MRRAVVLASVSVAVVAALIGAAAERAHADAGPTHCDGSLRYGTFPAIVVPVGARCVLGDGVEVLRDVAVRNGGSLTATGIRVGRNLVATKPRSVRIDGSPSGSPSRIAVNIVITGVVGAPAGGAANAICNSDVGGTVTIADSATTAAP